MYSCDLCSKTFNERRRLESHYSRCLSRNGQRVSNSESDNNSSSYRSGSMSSSRVSERRVDRRQNVLIRKLTSEKNALEDQLSDIKKEKSDLHKYTGDLKAQLQSSRENGLVSMQLETKLFEKTRELTRTKDKCDIYENEVKALRRDLTEKSKQLPGLDTMKRQLSESKLKYSILQENHELTHEKFTTKTRLILEQNEKSIKEKITSIVKVRGENQQLKRDLETANKELKEIVDVSQTNARKYDRDRIRLLATLKTIKDNHGRFRKECEDRDMKLLDKNSDATAKLIHYRTLKDDALKRTKLLEVTIIQKMGQLKRVRDQQMDEKQMYVKQQDEMKKKFDAITVSISRLRNDKKTAEQKIGKQYMMKIAVLEEKILALETANNSQRSKVTSVIQTTASFKNKFRSDLVKYTRQIEDYKNTNQKITGELMTTRSKLAKISPLYKHQTALIVGFKRKNTVLLQKKAELEKNIQQLTDEKILMSVDTDRFRRENEFMEKELEKSRDDMNASLYTRSVLSDSKEVVKKEKDKAMLENSSLKQTNDGLLGTMKKQTDEINRLSTLNQYDREEIVELKDSNRKLDKQLKQIKNIELIKDTAIIKLEKNCEKLTSENNKIASDLRQSKHEIDVVRMEYKNHNDCEAQIATLKELNSRLSRDHKDCDKTITTLRNTHKSLEEKYMSSHDNTTRLNTNLTTAEMKLSTIQTVSSLLQKKVQDQTLSIESKNSELISRMVDISELNKKIKAQTEIIDRHDRKMFVCESKISDIEKHEKVCKKKMEDLTLKYEDSVHTNRMVLRENQVLETKIKKYQTDGTLTTRDIIQGDVNLRKEKDISDELRLRLEQVSTVNNTINKRCKDAETKLESLVNQFGDIQLDNDKLKGRLSLEKERSVFNEKKNSENADVILGMHKKLSDILYNYEKLETNNSDLTLKCGKYENDIKKLMIESKSNTDKKASASVNIESLQKLLKESYKEIVETKDKNIKLETELKSRIDTIAIFDEESDKMSRLLRQREHQLLTINTGINEERIDIQKQVSNMLKDKEDLMLLKQKVELREQTLNSRRVSNGSDFSTLRKKCLGEVAIINKKMEKIKNEKIKLESDNLTLKNQIEKATSELEVQKNQCVIISDERCKQSKRVRELEELMMGNMKFSA